MKSTDFQHKVFVIIVNWNGKIDTLDCIKSLDQVRLGKNSMTVVVVDNGSTDDSIAVIRSTYPEVTVIPTGSNLGFTGGNNVGIAHALERGADIIWLLNNDTITDKNALDCLSVFDDPKVGACGSKIYFAPGREFHKSRYSKADRGHVLWYAGGIIDWKNMYASHRGVDEVDKGQYNTIVATPFITGCSFFVRSTVIRTVGLLDNRFYLYLEDLDWSVRIQKAGWKTLYAPTSVIWHINAGSSGKPGNPLHEYYFTRNRLLIGFKCAPLRTKIALLKEGVHFLFGNSKIRRHAVLDALFLRFGKQYDPKTYS